MSNSIDERVVNMQFNNKQFESGVSTSLSSIEKLKKGMNFDGASKSLSGLSEAGKRFSLAGIAEGVGQIAGKFSTLGIIGVTALQNITNSAINAGKQIASALIIDPITTGFSEYELKMNSVQTIMAGTGEDLERVMTKLNELNEYADRTVYSFSDMTSNIGKFTNAGVSLDQSVAAIQGVANVAAVSGASSNEASRAMYNFAQALSSGYVKLIDWKSIEVANMGTVEFKQQLIDAAVAAGTLTKSTDGMYKTLKGHAISATLNFNDSLQDQWMTTEVLVNTLNDYADETTEIGKKATAAAQDIKTLSQMYDTLKESAGSGWAETWEIIFGNYDEAKLLFTELGGVLSDILQSSAKARNEMLKIWKKQGGREDLIQSFRNLGGALESIVTPIKNAFDEIFPALTGTRLAEITKSFKEFTEKLKIGDDTADKLKRTFAGVFAVLDLIKDAFGFVLNVAGKVFGLFAGPSAGGILTLTSSFGDLLVKLHDTVEAGNIFGRAFEKIQDVFTAVSDKIKDAISRIKDAFKSFKSIDLGPLDEFSEKSEKKLRPFTYLSQIFGAAFEAIVKVLEWAAPIVAKLGSVIGKGLGTLADTVSYAVENMDFKGILDLINTGLFGAILVGIRKFIKSLNDSSLGGGNFLKSITNVLDGVRGSLESYQDTLKAKTLLTIAGAIGILAAALLVISLIDSDKLVTALAGITTLFVELSAVMLLLSKKMGSIKLGGVATQMVIIAVAILILSAAMKRLADLDWEGIAKGTLGIAALATALVVSAKKLEKISGDLIKSSVGLIAFSVAILILSAAMKRLADLDWEGIAKGTLGIAALANTLVVSAKKLNKISGDLIKSSVGLIAFSVAILILTHAVDNLAQLSWNELARGLIAMAGALIIITKALDSMPKDKEMISKATGMVIMGVALLIIADAMSKFGSMSLEGIARGLIAMAGVLIIITKALDSMPKDKEMIRTAIGLIAVAIALQIMIGPLERMAEMSLIEIAKSLIMLGGSLLIIAKVIKSMTGGLNGAKAMLVMAAAIRLLTPALVSLGSMHLTEIIKALLALAGVFVVMGVAAYYLKDLIPYILGLAAAVALLGAGVALAGVGLLAISAALAALSVSASVAAEAIVIIGSAILSLLPMLFEKIGEGILALGNVIIDGAPIIKDAFLALLSSALEAITESAPMIAESVFTLLISILDALVKNTPAVVERVFDFLIGILNAIAKKLPELIKAGIDVLMALFSGIIDALSGIDVKVLLKGIAGIGLLSLIVLALAAVAALVPAAMIGVLGMGVIIAELALVLAAIGALSQIPGLKWLIDEGAELMESIGNAIGSFIGGIVGGFMTGVSSSFPQIGTDLSAFMTNIQPFIDGARKIDASTMNGVKALAEVILILTAANILDGLTSWLTGGSSLSGFAEELVPFGRAMKAFADEVVGIDSKAVSSAAIAGKTLAEMAATLPNTGGVLGFFAGENDMEAFGKQLVPFGRAMKAFADEVSGLKAGVVTEAATAGKALAEMATTVPNSGGVVGFFAGENDIETFGKQLVPFGKAMKAFSIAVTGLKADVIINSVTAGQALMELADTVPNSGGAVGFFAGENDMDAFGKQLIPFGKAMKNYSIAVTGMDSNVVANSANAAKALVELSANLPNTGGIISWFTGDNNIATFGTQLVAFGQSFRAYAESVSTIDTPQLSGVIAEFKKIVDIASGIQAVGTSGLVSFVQNLTSIGNEGIDGFVKAFSSSDGKMEAAVSAMLKKFISATNAKKSEFKSAGGAMMNSFVSGINLDAAKSKYAEFYEAGKYLVKGFANGITAYTFLAEARSKDMASAAVKAAKKELAEKSPSKVGYKIGAYFGLGFVNAIGDYVQKSYKAGSEIAKSARDGLSNAILNITDVIEEGIDTQPTIRPVLDLTNVETGTSRLNALFSRTQAMSISTDMARTSDETIQNGGNSSDNGKSFSFVQNNYSPKPLSRLELYRQTKNQISVMKGLV